MGYDLPMPPLSSLSIELVVLVLGAWCLVEAWRSGFDKVAILATATLFGLAIEVFFVSVYSGYAYGDFLLDVPLPWAEHTIPIWVGVGWGAVIFTAMRASDRTGIAWYLRAPLDALLAVSVDLALDPMAEALGWWHWTRDVDVTYFGVPYDNFVGWLMIVGWFSLLTRGGLHLLSEDSGWRPVVPLPALVLAAGAVAGLQLLFDNAAYPVLGEPLTWLLLTTVFTALLVRPMLLGDAEAPQGDRVVLGVPTVIHLLLLVLLVVTGAATVHPELVAVLPVTAVLSVLMFTWPDRRPGEADD